MTMTMCKRMHVHDDDASARACDRLPGAVTPRSYRTGVQDGPAAAPVLAIVFVVGLLIGFAVWAAVLLTGITAPGGGPGAYYPSYPVPTTYGPPGPDGGAFTTMPVAPR